MVKLVFKVESAIDQICNTSTCGDLLCVLLDLDWSAFLVIVPCFLQQTCDSLRRRSL